MSGEEMIVQNLHRRIKEFHATNTQKDTYIHQLRGALGYEVPGNIPENTEVVNGISDALQLQITRLEGELAASEKELQIRTTSCNEALKKVEELQEENAVLRTTSVPAIEERDAAIRNLQGKVRVLREALEKIELESRIAGRVYINHLAQQALSHGQEGKVESTGTQIKKILEASHDDK